MEVKMPTEPRTRREINEDHHPTRDSNPGNLNEDKNRVPDPERKRIIRIP